MTEWVSVVGSLAGVVVGFVGSLYLAMWQEHRTWRNQRALAVSEALSAAADVQLGAHMVRTAYLPTSELRERLRLGAQIFAALATGVAGREAGGWRGFGDARNGALAVGSLLDVHREQTQRQRQVVLDLSTLVAARSARFYSAVAAPPIRTEPGLVEVKDALIEAVGNLVQNIAAKEPAYAEFQDRAIQAVVAFRSSSEALAIRGTLRRRILGRWSSGGSACDS